MVFFEKEIAAYDCYLPGFFLRKIIHLIECYYGKIPGVLQVPVRGSSLLAYIDLWECRLLAGIPDEEETKWKAIGSLLACSF